MRLVDLLLVLLLEGRDAVSWSTVACASNNPLLPKLRRLDSSAEKSQRHLIDCIRSKDTEALMEAVNSGGMYDLIYIINLILCIKKYKFCCLI